ncbi:terpenoid cyclases/protein prenyltransferase alpha-alpha toroid [Xylariaceae sp. FL0804]|nr:terpenoid cyclases/protein prenyltransferase alpha-alpha toroid [Xylariaceae sp. FL0804]
MAAAPSLSDPFEPHLDTAVHIRYWQRCLRSVLPHHYTSNDSIRLTLGFFILAALDLLSPSPSGSPSSSSSSADQSTSDPTPPPLIPAADVPRLRAWVLSLQHPHGGFCGSPHHVLPRRLCSRFDSAAEADVARDPANANIAATYFALLLLGGVLSGGDGDGDDADAAARRALDPVARRRTLRWLRRLQRPDGSFGEVVVDADGADGRRVAGGRDMRYCYLAATIRWVLGGAELDGGALDFDVGALVRHIRQAQTFDGGMAESSMHESHAGYAYCAVASLAMLDLANPDPAAAPDHYLRAGIPSIPALIHFLVDRQLTYLDPDSDTGSDDEDEDESDQPPLPDLASLTLSDDPDQSTGFNGRPNKVPDTCYAWWVSGALALLGEGGLVERAPARRFLLDKTQHRIGGFAKHPGGPPDVYHAYLGLAALSTLAGTTTGGGGPEEAGAGAGQGAGQGGDEGREAGLRRFDARLCLSVDATARLKRAREGLLAADREEDSEEEDEEEEDPDGRLAHARELVERSRKSSL